MADIPGIIEGAHRGAGLGLQFLRHVQRTRVLLYVVDASGTSGRDPAADLATLRQEAALWDPALLERPALVAASKRDALDRARPAPGLAAGRAPRPACACCPSRRTAARGWRSCAAP